MLGKGLVCPCCGYLTIPDDGTYPGTFFVCPVCYWEDDDVQFHDPNFRGGANEMSLNEARAAFVNFGSVDPKLSAKVRPPRPEEMP
ncbi:CPCC family cysteine-rich protein [Dyella tabacisoli]|uniref:Hydrolase n=2 Tax=Dyella tabacisoli TaxID=2282381 RepID=A0A369UH34_9GAMM|nr:hydrolase [Dyella tabacisoli]